jgi:hypothetical protein
VVLKAAIGSLENPGELQFRGRLTVSPWTGRYRSTNPTPFNQNDAHFAQFD